MSAWNERRARNNAEKVPLAAPPPLKTTLQNIKANEEALAKKGQKPEDTTLLQELHDDLVTDTTDQDANNSTRKGLTQDNIAVLNALNALERILVWRTQLKIKNEELKIWLSNF